MKTISHYCAVLTLSLVLIISGCSSDPDYDVIIRNGLIYDGSGGFPEFQDIAVSGDTIAVMGDLRKFKGEIEIDADGLVLAPGFINTDMIKKVNRESFERNVASIGMRRIGTPEDVACTALFLASDLSGGINSQVLVVRKQSRW